MHGTLNHLLLTDRLWLKRLTGEGDHPAALDAIIHEDRGALTRARADEDHRIIGYVDPRDEAVSAVADWRARIMRRRAPEPALAL